MKMKKIVGLIGCGAIGTVLAEAIERKIVICDELVIFDMDASKAEKLKDSLKFPVKIFPNVDELLLSKPSIVVEAASQQAVQEYYKKILAANIDFIIMSTGALLDLNTNTPKLHFPSGAIGGLDAISPASLAGINEVTLTTRKPPEALGKNNTQEETVYEGYAEEAARQFPREMNVAATLALTVKPAKVKVQVVSDPTVVCNTHEIHVKWRYGEMTMKFANDPHPDNPHTSALAAWSAINLLKSQLEK
jgi:aspartate dehydrogenase